MAKIGKSRDNSDDGFSDDEAPANTPIVMTKKYRREQVDPVRNFFNTNYSDLAKQGIAQLWQRRFDPSHEQVRAFSDAGLHSLIRDYRHADFGAYIRDALVLGIFADDLDRFLSMHGHSKDLMNRLTDPKRRTAMIIQTAQVVSDPTQFTYPYYSSAEAGNFFAFLDRMVEQPCCSAAVVGCTSKVDLPPFVMIADNIAIEARRANSFQLSQFRTNNVAMVWHRTLADDDTFAAIDADFSFSMQDTNHVICDFTVPPTLP